MSLERSLTPAPARRWLPAVRARRRAEPTPLAAWAAALGLALAGAWGIVHPAAGCTFALLALVAALGARVIARPVDGFVLALGFFPAYTALRGLAQMYGVPVPMEMLGMWPELILIAIFAGIVLRAIRQGRRLALTWYDAPIVVLLLAGAYGVALSLAQGEVVATVYGVHYSISALLFYFGARFLQPTPADLRRILAALIVPYVLLALLSLADYVFRPMFVVKLAMVVREGYWKQWDPVVFFRWYPRMQSLLFHEGIWGSLSALVSLMCMARFGATRFPGRVGLLFALSTLGLLLSMSRGALMAWVVGIVVLLLFPGRHRQRVALTAAGLLALVGLCVFLFGADKRVESLLTRTVALADTQNQLAYDRMSQWELGLQTSRLAPAGRGLGMAGHASYYHGGQALNDTIFDGGYFRLLAEQGWPGVAIVLLGIGAAVWVLARLTLLARGQERVIGLTTVAYLCGLCAQNVGSNALDFFYTPHVLWMLAGLFVARRLGAEEAAARESGDAV